MFCVTNGKDKYFLNSKIINIVSNMAHNVSEVSAVRLMTVICQGILNFTIVQSFLFTKK
jgi:hypothetical protein